MAKKLNIATLEPKIRMQPVEKKDKRYIRCHVLIVCEGEKTEPNYFRSFHMMQNSSGLVYVVNTDGGGINTIQVVEKAIKLRKEAAQRHRPYDAVWVVFDRDSFKSADFDNAVSKAQSQGIGCAWSNEAFELWYVYHFDDRCTAMSRTEYKRIITQRVCSALPHVGRKYSYVKNDPNMRKTLGECLCDERVAIRRAERQSEAFEDHRYHTHNPCTMVYKLVKQLIGDDMAFVALVKSRLEEK